MAAIELTSEQSENLAATFEFAKALAAPTRLALLGFLAARPKEVLLVAEVSRELKFNSVQLEKDLNQLAEAGFIQIDEWHSPKAGSEPQPLRISFQPDYAKNLARLVTTLAQINNQVRPPEKAEKLDERAKTIGRFLKEGKLIGWPTQYKRQLFLLEEIAKVFEPNLHYSERQVDTILKEIYAYDHCMLRRALVDLGYLRRENGIYHKSTGQLEAV